MYKIIGGDQKEYGPATADEMRRWIADGRLGSQSLVQAEAGSEWRPLATFPEFAEDLRAQHRWEPAMPAVAAPADGAAWVAGVLARQPAVEIGRCLARSGRLIANNLGVLAPASFLIWAVGFAAQFNAVTLVLYLVLRGVFYGGLCVVFLKRIRGQPASVADSFAGFRIGFTQLLLAGFLSNMLSYLAVCCFLLPAIYLFVAWTFAVPLVADRGLEFWSAMELSRKVVTRVWFEVFGLLVLAYLPFLAMHVFIEAKLSLAMMPAMQQALASVPFDFKRLLQVLQQPPQPNALVERLADRVHLFNLPFALGALMYAYEGLFGARPEPAH